MKNRFAFTMIELIFVIVIMGILSKFGVEFLIQAYNNFIFSNVNNTLQAQSTSAVETISSRLQFRIKDSVIARTAGNPTVVGYQALPDSTYGNNARVLEWIASDIDGFRGDKRPLWSGIIDLNASTITLLNSPETNTTALDNQIKILSHGSGTGINNAALYFVGSDGDINGYGWDGVIPIITQNAVMHPINSTVNINNFATGNGTDFTGIDVYEYYQLAWTAYAVVLSTDGNLTLYYDYQPWQAENYTDGQEALIMQNVSTFRFKAIGSVIKIQVCVDGNITDGGYSICKEKTIF